MMSNTSVLRKLVVLQFLLSLFFFASPFLEGEAAENVSGFAEIANLVDQQALLNSVQLPYAAFVWVILLIIIFNYLLSLAGLYYGKAWARPLYFVSIVPLTLMGFLTYPSVVMPFEGVLGELSVLIDGAIVCLLIIGTEESE